MPNTIILIHGLGDPEPGWSDKWDPESIFPNANIVEFTYDQHFDKTKLHGISGFLLRSAAQYYLGRAEVGDFVSEYLDDLLVYFLVGAKAKRNIHTSLATLISEQRKALPENNIILLGHSLGGIVAYQTLLEHPDAKVEVLGTLASAMGGELSPLVKMLTKVKGKPDNCEYFLNVYARFDPLSGELADRYQTNRQIRINADHTDMRKLMIAASLMISELKRLFQ
jgi:pimeloyl-ACP methyl ester carboxylesterase